MGMLGVNVRKRTISLKAAVLPGLKSGRALVKKNVRKMKALTV
jgi:hypothetical protein